MYVFAGSGHSSCDEGLGGVGGLTTVLDKMLWYNTAVVERRLGNLEIAYCTQTGLIKTGVWRNRNEWCWNLGGFQEQKHKRWALTCNWQTWTHCGQKKTCLVLGSVEDFPLSLPVQDLLHRTCIKEKCINNCLHHFILQQQSLLSLSLCLCRSSSLLAGGRIWWFSSARRTSHCTSWVHTQWWQSRCRPVSLLSKHRAFLDLLCLHSLELNARVVLCVRGCRSGVYGSTVRRSPVK